MVNPEISLDNFLNLERRVEAIEARTAIRQDIGSIAARVDALQVWVSGTYIPMAEHITDTVDIWEQERRDGEQRVRELDYDIRDVAKRLQILVEEFEQFRTKIVGEKEQPKTEEVPHSTGSSINHGDTSGR